MKHIPTFESFLNEQSIVDLREFVIRLGCSQSQELMKKLYPYRSEELPSGTVDTIIEYLERCCAEGPSGYTTPKNYFDSMKYKTFMDYFTRRLSKETFNQIKKNKNLLSFPAECIVESFGDIHNTDEIIRLKVNYTDTVKDLKKAGISNVEDLKFVNMKLLKCFYHRIHSPITGKITLLKSFDTKDEFFGDNTLWLVKINSDRKAVYLLLIGELSIQDFNFAIKEGDEVKMFQEIGNFIWGSQVILFFDPNEFPKIDIAKTKYFVGDRIA